jgi:hypothetical protein
MSLFRRTDRTTETTEPTARPASDAPRDAVPAPSPDDLGFQLREAEKTISVLEGDLDRVRAELEQARRQAGGSDELTEAIGQPVAHLATQVALVGAGDSELTAADLAGIGASLLRALASAGIQLEGEVGATTDFDPNRHLALGAAPRAGASVLVRSPAVLAPSGRVVRKATVDAAG